MPLYDYECSSCNGTFEAIARSSEPEAPCADPCPLCNESGNIKKVILGCPPIVSGVIGVTHRVPHELRQRLREIKKAHPLGRLQD